jgi:hypothetical protein
MSRWELVGDVRALDAIELNAECILFTSNTRKTSSLLCEGDIRGPATRFGSGEESAAKTSIPA